jgi:hypothetical protein
MHFYYFCPSNFMLKQKIIKILSIIVLLVTPLSVFAQVDPGFNPNNLIEDKVFSDTQTFGGPEGIQRFLETKDSVLANTNPDFLARLKEPTIPMLKQALEDPEPSLGRLRTAAELIWDASRQSGLNPQVILVTLNKEQGLITARTDVNDPDLQRALDHSLGFACPDSGGCGNLFPGFYYQLFGNLDSSNNRYLGMAKSLMKSFNVPNGRGPSVNGQIAHVGDTVSIENTTGAPNNAAPSQMVTIANRATAALYRYTPHVFNGNYNFWRFFAAWFKYANGTIVKVTGDANTYIIQNGSRLIIPPFVATARALNLTNPMTISPTEAENYPQDKVFGPVDNTIAKDASGKKFVFIDNTPHPVSDFVIKQRGLNPDLAYNISADELNLFSLGSVLPPKDGSVIRGKTGAAVYLVEKGEVKLFSAFTLAQYKASKKIVIVPDEEIVTYQKGGYVAPLDGTIIKTAGNQSVYIMQSGLKQPMSAEVFSNRAIKNKDITILSPEELVSFPTGGSATPKDRSFFAVSGTPNVVYIFKEGSKHPISAYVAKQRGITPDFTVSVAEGASWQDGIAIPPKDGTVIKGDTDQTVFLVSGGQLKPLTFKAYTNRKITAKKIVTLSQAEVDSYAKGDTLEK